MAARRLIVVMVVMLAVATLSAALVPEPNTKNAENTTSAGDTSEATGTGDTSDNADNGDSTPAATEQATTTAGAEPGAATAKPTTGRLPRGELLRAEVKAGGRIEVIPVALGDQLSLEVIADPAGLVEIPRLGLTDYATPEAPARFDVLIERPGDYLVRRISGGRVITRIEVRRPD